MTEQMYEEQRRLDLADFLRTRRTRLSPEQAGLRGGGRRRTAGLRREEVAQLANVGVSWYTQLEQGRTIRPSRDVLHSIAAALQLTPAEQHHLYLLADQQPPVDTHNHEEQISSGVRTILDALNPLPAFIVGRRWTFLAWNTAAERTMLLSRTAPYGWSVLRRMFIDPLTRELSPDWEQNAQKVLAEFRASTTRFTHEAWYGQLLEDLQHASPEFREWWSRHDVRVLGEAEKRFLHPVVGVLVFEHVTLQVPAMPDLNLMVHTPVANTGTAEKIQRLMADDGDHGLPN